MRPAVFLDRDGVINGAIVRDGSPYPPADLGEFELLPGVKEAVESLRQAGFLIFVVTNQPDVATGKQRLEVVEAMHEHIKALIQLDDIKVCFHVDEDGCNCRKPKPGMLVEAVREYGVDLARSFMVGDRWRDIEAGQAVGCKTIWIESNYDEKKPNQPDLIVNSLREAVEPIIATVIEEGE
jgi:D-glycero-D-manno-heptose 1,7-bisphosphate phosphatase